MSDYTDDTLTRYLDQQPSMREALLRDPTQRAQAEHMRNLLGAAARAMAAEGVPEDTQRRVVNRIVWGEPEGCIDVNGERLAFLDAPVDFSKQPLPDL
ncbi:hypothetical protein ASD97_24925 [Streptomyces sp. Root63]|uniref:hypothetical protein n=1 Tax=unclassified Streptomyces TaxID=2593676 RepID=UPI0006FA4182|nr:MULTISPECIES: hypothetical protein [unclassified Streptomyces]KQX27547.1 hypothetical protein ASD29_30155 [Streptomyces sp. Root1295]KRA34787.1 hypothetical protein ASD97_24925 [Streptomyces sp. Root63]